MTGHRRQPSIELLELMGVVKENGNEQMLLPPVHTPLSYDYVLVAKTNKNQEKEALAKQMEYIEELKKKNIKVTVSDGLKIGLSSPHAAHQSPSHLSHIYSRKLETTTSSFMGFKHLKKSLRSTGTCSKCPMPATGVRTKTSYLSAPGRSGSDASLPRFSYR
ncbi:unnamed protein product [Tetraodon nigroviridis]|uniref:(spotted green pufferfish) hypothetical protein n=1 Tax=Tetraodon nigroviridis TaxID=99883 RepID=Q4S1F7_TETNG|nr:unnamed protein product [Tetraodon nigroviridis]